MARPERHPLYRTRWCAFHIRSHGCRWGDACWHCHSEEDFVRRPRAHYTFPLDLRLLPADADVPVTTLRGPQWSGWQEQDKWQRRGGWGADWHAWMDDWSGWDTFWHAWMDDWSGWDADWHAWKDGWSDWDDADWQPVAQWETDEEAAAHLTDLDAFVAAQISAQALTPDATYESPENTDEQPSVDIRPMMPLADPKLAALIRACSQCRPATLPADAPLPPPADPPGPSPAVPPDTRLLVATPLASPPADPPATRLLIATPLASLPPETPATRLQGAPPLPSLPPVPPATNLKNAPPPPPESLAPIVPCVPPPAPPEGPVQVPPPGASSAPTGTPVPPRIPRLDLTILSPARPDDPFEPEAVLFNC